MRYEPAPITRERVAESLSPPESASIRAAAAEFHHPLLPAIRFDERDGLSPDEAAVFAVLANPDLRVERDRRGIAGAQVLQAGILPNPELAVDVTKPISGDTKGTVTGYDAGLNWEVSSLLGRDAARDAAQKRAESVNLEIAWKEWQVAEAAKLQVCRVILARKQEALAREIEANAQEQLQTAEKAASLKDQTAYDRSAAAAEWQRTRLDRMAAEADVQEKQLELNRLLGIPPDRTVPLQSEIAFPAIDDLPTTADALAGLESRRLDLAALRLGYESQEASLWAAIQGQFPRISIGPTAGKDIENVTTVGFGVTIDFPLFDRNQGTIAEARATRKQLYDEYVARLFQARSDVTELLGQLAFVEKRIQVLQPSLQDLEDAVDGAKTAVRAGDVPVLTYYDLLLRHTGARKALLALQEAQASLTVGLEVATGTFHPTSDSIPESAVGGRK